jgi:hypothetical protein
MNAKPKVSAEINQSSEMKVRGSVHELPRAGDAVPSVENSDDGIEVDHLDNLLRRACEVATSEIDNLINEFHGLREKLQTDLGRIQRDISKYRELNQEITQMTTSISDGMIGNTRRDR